MSKFLKSLAALAVTAACMAPCFSADAATIALLPLVNNVADYEDAGAVFYDRAVEAIKKNGVYEIVDDATVDKAIAKYTKPGVLPKPDALRAICEEGNVDAVFAYELESLEDEEGTYAFSTEYFYKVHLRGHVSYYNTLLKKPAKYTLVVEDSDRPYSESSRFNLKEELYADSVTREVNRAIANKKLNFQGPRISARGQKGNY